jgi:hypothetical protein
LGRICVLEENDHKAGVTVKAASGQAYAETEWYFEEDLRRAQALTYESGQAFAEEMLLKGINTFGALQSELSSMIMGSLGEDTGSFADGYWDFLKASGEVLDSEYIASALNVSHAIGAKLKAGIVIGKVEGIMPRRITDAELRTLIDLGCTEGEIRAIATRAANLVKKAQGDPFQVGQKIEDMLASADSYKWWTVVERSNDEVLVKMDDNPTIQERLPVSELQQRIQDGQLRLASRQAQTLREDFERMVNEGQSFEEIGGFFGYDVTKREDALRLEEVLERFGPFASRQELENYLGRSLRYAQATEEEQQFATEIAKQVTEFAATEEDVAQLMELIKGKSFAKESRRAQDAAAIKQELASRYGVDINIVERAESAINSWDPNAYPLAHAANEMRISSETLKTIMDELNEAYYGTRFFQA